MTLQVDVQIACDDDGLPGPETFRAWARTALDCLRDEGELTVRIVGEEEGARLNSVYRNRAGATNVLSFPFEAPPGVRLPLLGDVVVCAPVAMREANEQRKALHAHFAHLVVHGVLHLLGFDHERAQDAERMEELETKILADLGYTDPYRSES